MLRLAAIALLALALATILDLRAADATAVSPLDPSFLQFCAGCERPKNDHLQIYLDWSVGTHTTMVDTDVYENNNALSFPTLIENLISDEVKPLIGNSPTIILFNEFNDLLKIDLQNPATYREHYFESNDCTYLESKLHDPKRVKDECSNIEPGTDYSELISVFTLSIVSVFSFALIALACLLHRAYRSWRLRKMIPKGAATPNRYVRKGRRRVDGSISA
jgi:hypothetical protein